MLQSFIFFFPLFQFNKVWNNKSVKILSLGAVYMSGVLFLILDFKRLSGAQKFHMADHFIVNNENRVAEAKSYLSDVKTVYLTEQRKRNDAVNFVNSNNNSCQLSISIITVSRENNQRESEQPHYLLQSVAALIKLINKVDQTKFKVQLSVCNVDHYPEKHIDMHYINEWLTVFQRNAEERKTYKNRYEKELLDYLFCMKHLLQQNSPYFLILEDDAIAHPDVFTVMERELFSNKKCELKREKFNNLLYIKLHTNSWDLNFYRPLAPGIDVEKILELVLLTLILDVSILRLCRKYKKSNMLISYNTFLILFIYIALLLNGIGRQNISAVWRYVLGMTHELSIARAGSMVAVLYPRAGVEATVKYLSSFKYDIKCPKCPKDLVVDALARKYKKQLLLIEPSLFTHIGYRTTKHQVGY